MGSPDLAVPTLDALEKSDHVLAGVVTNLDKRVGRSQVLKPTPVKVWALDRNLPVLQPESLNDETFRTELSGLKPDACVVVAFRILPMEVISVPRLGCVNLHPSLLPDLRGAAPINWALIHGYKKTGITTFLIEKSVDSGGILYQEIVDIEPEEDAGDLSIRLMTRGAALMVKTLDSLEAGIITPRAQLGKVTKAPKLDQQLCHIDLTKSASSISNLIRGLSPKPGAFIYLNKKKVKIFKARELDDTNYAKTGTFLGARDNCLAVQTGLGVLGIQQLQREGKKRLNATDFLRGHQLEKETIFN